MDTWGLLAIVALLILANAVFVAAEFALVTVDRAAITVDAEAGDKTAKGILAALRTLAVQLSGAQVGITLTSLVVGFLAEPAIASLLTVPLTALGLPESTALGVSLTAAIVIASATQAVFGELIPKNWAVSQPRRVAAVVTPLQRGFTTAFRPLIWLTNGNANWLLRRMGVEPVEELASARSSQELVSLVRHSGARGTLPTQSATLLDRALRFSDRQADNVMTPRTRVTVIPANASVADVLEICRRTGISRLPVVGDEGVDEVIGLVTLRDALRVSEQLRASVTVADVMSVVALIPETLPLDDVLPLVRGGHHLVVVVDEYGGMAGIVTLEDLVEELVGEVADEYDQTSLRHNRHEDGSWLLSGLLRPEDARDLGIPLPDDPAYDTIAGLVQFHLGRLGAVDDTIEVAGWVLTITVMDGHRIAALTAAPLERP